MDKLLNIDATLSTPFLDQIKEQIRARIRDGDLLPGDKIPSIRQLSETTGVSIGIVQRAVGSLIQENYLRSHPGRGVFVSESRLQNQNIALVLPTCELEQMPRFVRGAKRQLEGHTANLLVMSADSDFDQEIDMIDQLDKPFISGAVIYPPPFREVVPSLRELRRRGIPFVLVNTMFEELQADAVVCDWHAVGRLMLEELLTCGHRRIGLVDLSQQTSASFTECRRGAREILGEHGLDFKTLPSISGDAHAIDPEVPWGASEKLARQLLRENADLTAIAAFNDYLTLGVFRAAEQRHIPIPGQLSLVGISDLAVFKMCRPAVTVVDVRHEEMARLAVDRLLALLADPSLAPVQKRLPPILRRRQSVTPPVDIGSSAAG